MRRQTCFWLFVIAALCCLYLPGVAQCHGKEKKHHTLRGRITAIDPAAKTFKVETNPGHIVMCYVDSRSVIHRDGKDIQLKDIREGARVRCICSMHEGGRHYTLDLLVAPLKEPKD